MNKFIPLRYIALALVLDCLCKNSAVAHSNSTALTVYKVAHVFTASIRSNIAKTGALILETGHDYVLIEATTTQKNAVAQLGLTVAVPNQDEGKQLTPQAVDSRYHNYAEMVKEIQQTEIDHPTIFKLVNLSKSIDGLSKLTEEGRTIWAGKISDNVNKDEDEPEVLLTHHQHAREHLTVEQALYTLKMLTDEYNTDAQIKHLVDDREIWIIFDMNPDGGEYDIATGTYRSWRKNMQPNVKSKEIGTDLNRNWDYLWGCCVGNKNIAAASPTYHGDVAFSAPETQIVRDFVNSRVLNGVQQIKTAIDFHSYAELILWPYSYTFTDTPVDMTKDDQAVLKKMGEKMATMNGYKAQQWSDLYIADGTLNDWLYGVHGILNYTFEMYPKKEVQGGFYPSGDVIFEQTKRNRNAILYLIEQSACPYDAINKKTAYCSPITTHFYTPSDDLAVRRNAGNNDGYEISPANAYSYQKANAMDINSGTNNSVSCNDESKDKHDFYDYSITLPSGDITVNGIDIKLQAKADNIANKPHICVQLSWDNGATWTKPKTTPTLSTHIQSYLLGGVLDTWGHTWVSDEFNNNNFKVRLTNVASTTARDFSLGWIAVRLRYQVGLAKK